MKILFLINDAPYGTEKFYNACRLAMQVQKNQGTDVFVFLMADAVTGALINQKPPQGYYNIERMIKSVIMKGGKIRSCGTCLDARGLKDSKSIDGVERSNMKELTELTIAADKVITF